MPSGFGFSIGDFVAVLSLVQSVIDALKSSGGARDRFKELIRQLYTLEKALIRVKDVELDDEQEADRIALHHASSHCKQTIDAFLTKITKYQPYMGSGAPGPNYLARAKAALMAVRWVVCREEDITKLKADLNAHVISIELLLLAVQMNKSSLDARKEKQRNSSLITQLRDTANMFLEKFASIARQMQELQDMARQVVRVNFQVFHTVMAIHKTVERLPRSIEREQPVILTDPFGRISPFHLEFIRSKECFMAVLRIHFENAGANTTKLEKEEYFVEELSTRRRINLNGNWRACFQPGQHVAMSVVFKHLQQDAWNSCPGCQTVFLIQDNEEVDCPKCGITFRRIVEDLKDTPRFRTYSVSPIVTTYPQAAENPTFSGAQDWPLESERMQGDASSSVNDTFQVQAKRKLGADEEAERESLKRFRRLGYYPPEAQGLKCDLLAFWNPEWGRKKMQGKCKATIYNIGGNPYLNVRDTRTGGWTLMHENLLEMDCIICRMDDHNIVFAGTLKYPKYTKCEPPSAHMLSFESEYACSTIWLVIPAIKKANAYHSRMAAISHFWSPQYTNPILDTMNPILADWVNLLSSSATTSQPSFSSDAMAMGTANFNNLYSGQLQTSPVNFGINTSQPLMTSMSMAAPSALNMMTTTMDMSQQMTAPPPFQMADFQQEFANASAASVNVASSSPTEQWLEVKSLSNSDNGWTAISASHLSNNPPASLIFQPAQSLHIRTNSNSAQQSDVVRTAGSFSSFEEIKFPMNSPSPTKHRDRRSPTPPAAEPPSTAPTPEPAPYFNFSAVRERALSPNTKRTMTAKETAYKHSRRRAVCASCRIRKLRCMHMDLSDQKESPDLTTAPEMYSTDSAATINPAVSNSAFEAGTEFGMLPTSIWARWCASASGQASEDAQKSDGESSASIFPQDSYSSVPKPDDPTWSPYSFSQTASYHEPSLLHNFNFPLYSVPTKDQEGGQGH